MAYKEGRTHYLWVEGVSAPIPKESQLPAEDNATNPATIAFLRTCVPQEDLFRALPTEDWQVVEFLRFELHIIKVPYRGRSYAEVFMQHNTRSDKVRLLISFPDYQIRGLRLAYQTFRYDDDKLYREAANVAHNSATLLAYQKSVERAVEERRILLNKLISFEIK